MAEGAEMARAAGLPVDLAALAARWSVAPEALAAAIARRGLDPAAAVAGFAARWRAAGRPEPAPGRFGWAADAAPERRPARAARR